MLNSSGSIALNGISDTEMAEIFEIKAKHQGQLFNFNPQQMQLATVNTPQGVQTYYNNVVFAWNGDAGLEIVQGIILFLLKKDEKAKVVGQ